MKTLASFHIVRTRVTGIVTAIFIATALQSVVAASASAQALRPEDAFGPKAAHRKSFAKAHGKPSAPSQAKLQAAPQPKPLQKSESKPEVKALGESGIGFNVRHAAAIDLALAGKSKEALAALESLLEEPSMSSADKDLVHLTMGRTLYGSGEPARAIEHYKKVSRATDAWYSAIEERAWSHLRLDQPEEALAQLKTLLLPVFKNKVGAEAHYLAALTQLRVCNYKQVFATIREFKKRFRPLIKDWESAGDAEAREHLLAASETIQKLSLIEAETIQRVYMPGEVKGHVGAAHAIKRGRNDISFPETEGDEVWMDEATDFQVSAKGCPKFGTAGGSIAGSSSGNAGGRL